MRRQQLIYHLLLLILKHTGKADSEISVSVQQSAGSLTVSCCLAGEDSITQVNWVMTRGANSTKLGTYHPQFGVHIDPHSNGSVVIEGSATEHSSRIHLKGGDVETRGREVCCIFHVFPSGVLEKCTVAETTAEAQEAGARTEEQDVGQGRRTVAQWCLLVGGCLVCLTSIIICLYYCWRCCCRFCCWRKRVYEVQTYLSDCGTDSEESTNTPSQNQHPPAVHLPQPQPQPQPQQMGFDPSRLYAKIKLDLLYGRIWKAYQGTARARAPATLQQEIPPKVREVPAESGPETPQPDPATQFVHDSDLPQHLSNHVQSSPNPDHNPEPNPALSQPESLNHPSV
ncbi:uncharacterized protein [Centroberyx affinis]|uniref:uncharacterized protein isoform X2 n=1 Tax=Centroberyx affinis TaxID=166261 RepID=UPI003A5C32A3